MEKNYNFQDLFNQKKYSEIIYIIEFDLPDEKKNLSIINLLGVCRLLQNNRTKEDLILALDNFKSVYKKEKHSEISLKAFRNYVNVAADLYDLDKSNSPPEKTHEHFEEALSFFYNDESYFLNDELSVLAIIRIHKRLLDINKVKFLLGELVKKKYYRPTNICSYIYNNLFFKDWSQEKFLEYGKILNENLTNYNQEELFPLTNKVNKKITIGFLSGDIRSKHSITYFLKTIIDTYNKNKYSINLYLNQDKSKEDETTKYFLKNVNKFTYIKNLKDEDAINLIRKDGVDIFIDLIGVTSDTRLSLVKNRVASSQILWCGYNNTTGLKEIDYILADPNLIYESEKNMYTEKVLYLPKIWNCHSGFDQKRPFIPSPTIENNYITFGSFNNFSKISDPVVKTWSNILKSIKNSKLILKSSIPRINNILIKKFKDENVLDSLEFIPYSKNFEDHIKSYEMIDIALDTFPYPGVTTSFEAIWMGTPVLTMKGYNFNSRCGESINKNLGLNWLVAENEEDYILKAQELSQKTDYLFELRKKLFDEAITSPLFDTVSFSSNFFKILDSINSKT